MSKLIDNSSISFYSKKIDIKKKLNTSFGKKKTFEILKKTGPKFLNICSDKEDSLSIAIKSFKKLKYKKENIKNLIFVTETPVMKFPGNSFLFASKLNFKKNINMFDLNAGCSGFIDALKIAKNLNGNSLIVCSETYSKNIGKFNRSLSTLFADGAVSFLFENKKIKILKYETVYEKNSSKYLCQEKNKNMTMNGGKVFSFVTSEVLPIIIKFINNNKDKRIKKIYLHQGSKYVCDYLEKKLKNFKINIPSNIINRGNLVSATIPVLIHDDLKKNKLKKNDMVILCGFGVGLTCSIMLLKVYE